MKITKKGTSIFILIYLLIITNGSVIWSLVIKGSSNYIILFATMLFVLLLMIINNVGLRRSFLLYSILSIACYFISAAMNGVWLSSGLNVKSAIGTILYILIVIATIKIGGMKSINVFLRMTFFFAAISLPFYFIQNIFGLRVFPEFLFHSIGMRNLHGFLFYTVPGNEPQRNFGIFYEPGTYQIVLNAAIYICVFYSEYTGLGKRKNTLFLVAYISALLTSLSTTGYIGLGIIGACAVFERKNKYAKRVTAGIIIVIIIFTIDYIYNGVDSIIYRAVIVKFISLGFSEGTYSLGSSGGARLFVIQQAIEALKVNPFFGYGGARIRYLLDTIWYKDFGSGNAIFLMIASRGLVTFSIVVLPIIIMAYKNRINKFGFICFILLFINSGVAQSEIWYSAFVFLALLPYKTKKSNNQNKLTIANDFII